MQHLDPAIAAQRSEDQRFHGERVEARQRHNNVPFNKAGPSDAELAALLFGTNAPGLETLLFDAGAHRPKVSDQKAAEALGKLLALAFVFDLIGNLPTTEPETQERITPFDEQASPPFFRFWKNLNARLARTGRPEATYGFAKAAFEGGPTPVGALTFVGKEFDGLRAVPVSLDPGERPTYNGEYREVTDNGTRWHKVVNNSDFAISYASAEAAIRGAQHQRNERILPSHR